MCIKTPCDFTRVSTIPNPVITGVWCWNRVPDPWNEDAVDSAQFDVNLETEI